MDTVSGKLIKWVIFDVIIALTPLYFATMVFLVEAQDVNLTRIACNGELALITAGICAISIGEMVEVGKNHPIARTFALGSSVIILILATALFAEVAALRSDLVKYNAQAKSMIADLSAFLFLAGVVTGGSCVYLSGKK